jgi:hypothetical protein
MKQWTLSVPRCRLLSDGPFPAGEYSVPRQPDAHEEYTMALPDARFKASR